MHIPIDIGGVRVFRSDRASEDRVYDEVKDSVFKEFAPGVYTDKKEVVKIVNFLYKQYYKILDKYLPIIDPNSFVTFLVEQYELYGKVADKHKLGYLSDKDSKFWASHAINARRGIKHLLELLCISNMRSDKKGTSLEEQWNAISMVFIAAEELVELYMRSDHYSHLLDEIYLRLNPEEHTYFDVKQDGESSFGPKGWARGAEKYLSEPDYLADYEAHSEILMEGFCELLGITYAETISIINYIIVRFSDENSPEKIGIFRRPAMIDFLKYSFPGLKSPEILLDGFSLSPYNMQNEGRELFRPKQEYRAYKRAFFRDQSDLEDRLFFSYRMAKEALALLMRDLAFKKLPPEWKNEKINKGLDKISREAGRWFENVVKNNLESVGILGVASLKRLRFKDGTSIAVDKDVGEIDFIGFNSIENMLIVIEVKQVGFSTESRMYLDDYSKFIEGKGSYSDKFLRKINWAQVNHDLLEKYMREKFDESFCANLIGYAMIVRYPLYISHMMTDFTCMTLNEFMDEYKLSGRQWVFSKKELSGR